MTSVWWEPLMPCRTKKSIVFVSLCWCTVNVFMYSMLLDVQKLHVNRWSGLFLLMPVNLLLKINENWRHHLFAASTPSTLSLKAPQNPQTLFVAASRSPCQKEAVSELCLHVVILVTSNMRTWFFFPLYYPWINCPFTMCSGLFLIVSQGATLKKHCILKWQNSWGGVGTFISSLIKNLQQDICLCCLFIFIFFKNIQVTVSWRTRVCVCVLVTVTVI